MNLRPTKRTRRSALVPLALAAALGLGACGGDDDTAQADAPTEQPTDATDAPADDAADTTDAAEPTIAENTAAPVADVTAVAYDTDPAQPTRIRVEKDEQAAALIPAGLADDGVFTVGVTSGDFPPLVLLADDEETIIGNELDIAYLVADTLGLELDAQTTSWENLFLSIESSQYDAGFSNITVTEERKDKYDFATYRVDSLAWEAPADLDIIVDEPADIAGLNVAVGSGTNQEQVLLAWDQQNQDAGLEAADIQYFSAEADFILALESGRLDLYFGPAPSAAYRHAVRGATKIVGVVPGGGEVPAQIAAMTVKGSGWAEPIAAALNHVIETGAYQQVLDKWGLTVEGLPVSEVNPPGLPRS